MGESIMRVDRFEVMGKLYKNLFKQDEKCSFVSIRRSSKIAICQNFNSLYKV